jgi:uncharacterized protein YqcC (DUF446 family)
MSFDTEQTVRAELSALVDELERVLKQLDYWQPGPTQAVLRESAVPFSCDTLSFPQWLQWQFIPRMRSVLCGGAPLPGASAIYPYAEICLADADTDVSELLALIERVDAAITAQDGETVH